MQDALGRYANGYLLGRFGFDVQPYGHVHGLKRRLRDPCFQVGDTMEVLDPDAGELLKVYVFAACLPYSGELYAEGFYDMKEESWVAAHVHAFSFYGGSVPIIVPDNLKQGISKNTFDELVANDQYRRRAEYYGCAVVPARPRRPRGKGAVEMGVRVIDSAPWRRCATACSPRSRS